MSTYPAYRPRGGVNRLLSWADDFANWFLYGHETWLVAVLKAVPFFPLACFLLRPLQARRGFVVLPLPSLANAVTQRLADPNGHVDLIVLEMDETIAESQTNVDLRKLREKVADDRQHVQSAEDDRRGDHQLAARDDVFTRCRTLGLGDLIENTARGGHVSGASVRE